MFKASTVIHRLVQERHGIPLVDAGASVILLAVGTLHNEAVLLYPSNAEQYCERRRARGLQEARVSDASAVTWQCWQGKPPRGHQSWVG